MTTEKVFEILSEGGGISIKRQKSKIHERFVYEHNEFDPTDEGLDVYKKVVYQSFEEPFQLINDRYPWYNLYIETAHKDYRDYIIDRLIEKLNDKSIRPDSLGYRKQRLEESLDIELECKMVNIQPVWGYSKAD